MKQIEPEKLFEIIEAQAKGDESAEIEFKSANGGFPGSFWETYSSFANTEGGLIVFGVKESKGRFFLDGLDAKTISKHKKDFWSNVNNKNTVNLNLLTESDVIDVDIDDSHFLVFRIPMAERSQRPIHLGFDPYNGTFKRNFEGDYHCTPDEVKRMFADADVSKPADQRILDNYTMDDIDKVSLEQFRRLFSIAKPEHPWLALNDIELLTQLGGYRKDKKTGKEGFTLAGLLMFGKYNSIIDPECAPYFFPDYQLYASTNPKGSERWIDRIYPDGTWEANLFQFYRLVLPRLTSALPKPFKLDEDTRIDETTAHVAIREALINLCVHADYSTNASLVVRQFPTSIELSNPGTLLISKWQYYRGGESVCRNTSLQKMFSMFGKAEKAGSGAAKIIQGWKDQHWRIPVLEQKSRPDKVELVMRQESIIPDETKTKLVSYYGEECLDWSHDILIALALACEEGEVRNEDLQLMLQAHPAEITDLLRDLKKKGYLESEGYGRGTRYHIPESRMSQANDVTSNDVTSSDVTSNGLTSNTLTSSGLTSNDATSNDVTSNDVTSKKDVNVQRRMDRGIAIDMILAFCSGQFRSLEEIAAHLGRNVQYVSRHYILPMEKDGLIRKRYAGKPNHPLQQYISITK